MAFRTRSVRPIAVAILVSTVSTTWASKPASTIRDVDFQNFPYAPSCLEILDFNPPRITVQDGVFDGRNRGGTGTNALDYLFLRVEQVAYGALTRDGREAAVVVTACNTGGTGDWTDASIYKMRNGKPVLLTTYQGGDRADGGIVSVRIKHELLYLSCYGTKGGLCCPEWVETTKYRLRGNQLVEVGVRTRRTYRDADSN